MGDKALRGNRLTAQGGGRIAGPARRAQESGFYSPDMGMRGKFGYKHGKRVGKVIGGVIKGGKSISKLLKNLGKEIKAQPLPPQLKGKVKELQKAFPHHGSKGRLKKAEGGRTKKVGREIKTSKGQAGLWTRKARKEFKKGGTDKNWIQKAVDPKHKGFCTPMTKKTCTPRRKALARTFKKMGRERKAKG